MSNPFYHIKRRHKDPPRVRHVNNNQKNHQIGPCNKTKFKSNENNQGYAARAQELQLLRIIFSIPIPKNAPPKIKLNDQISLQTIKTPGQYL